MTEHLDDSEGVLYRQIHPELLDEGEPASSAFKPTPNDKGKLSVDRSKLTTAKQAFDLFIARGFKSIAVYGVSVSEFRAEGILCVADPVTDQNPQNPAHALADFTKHNTSQKKKKAKNIKEKALDRGRLHP